MKYTVGDGSPHAVEPIQQFAAVVIFVPEVEDGQNDQRGHENSHLISPSPSAPIERTFTFVCERRDLIPHFDESHFRQCTEIVRTDTHRFGSFAFDIAQHPAEMDRPLYTQAGQWRVGLVRHRRFISSS
jgi:hypothetical protein